MCVALRCDLRVGVVVLRVLEVDVAGVVHVEVVEAAWIVKAVRVGIGLGGEGWRCAAVGLWLGNASPLLP